MVFRARDTKLQREVALKLLPDHFASDPDRLSRFQREAELLASLNHPNIAHVYGLEESNNTRCIVMELVDGARTLYKVLSAGTLSIEDASRLATEIVDGLTAIHQRGLTHGDLHEKNVLIDSRLSAKYRR